MKSQLTKSELIRYEEVIKTIRDINRSGKVDEVTFDNICDKYNIPERQRKMLYFI